MKLCAASQFPFVCLRDCGEVVTGSTPPKANSEFWGGEIPFVTPAQLGFQPPITTADEYVTREGADRGRLLPEGAVLVCCIGSLGKTGIAGVPLISNQQVNAVIFDPIQVDARYGYHAAGSLTPLLEHFAPSTTVKIVKKSAFEEFQIPLPPLAEQKRIAGILDAADALRVKRREALVQLDTLLQSTFLDMFGDPVTNPMGWEERALGEAAQDGFRNGLSPSTKGTVDGEVLTLSAITRGHFDFAARKNARFDQRPSSSQKLRTDTFLICRGNGNRRLVGTGVYPDRSSNRVCFPDTMIGVAINPRIVATAYLQHVWRTRRVRRQIEGGARTTNGTHKVNQRLLSSVVFPVPTMDLQHRFAAIVQSVERQKARQHAHLAELDTLFASLQSRAFRGEL